MNGRRLLCGFLGLGLWATTALGLPGGPLEPLLAALKGRDVGQITGRLFLEPARPEEAVKPLPGLAVVALPSSPSLWAVLHDVRQDYRASAKEYQRVLDRVDEILREYRGRVEAEGGRELIRSAITDALGRFEMRVPGGSWVVVTRYEEVTPIKGPAQKPSPGRGKTPSLLPGPPPPAKIRDVRVWIYLVEVPERGSVRVDLHDRNLWLSHLVKE